MPEALAAANAGVAHGQHRRSPTPHQLRVGGWLTIERLADEFVVGRFWAAARAHGGWPLQRVVEHAAEVNTKKCPEARLLKEAGLLARRWTGTLKNVPHKSAPHFLPKHPY